MPSICREAPKGILCIERTKIPMTHYIDELAKGLDLERHLVDSVSELTVDYTFSRYPDVADCVPYEEYDEETAKEKVEIAKKIFEYLKHDYERLLKDNK